MGIPVLISTSTASNAASIDITSGIDSTYDEYMFVCTDIGPATDNAEFQFQVNRDGQSLFDDSTATSTFHSDYHNEADDSAGEGYHASFDKASDENFITISRELGNAADESTAGILHLFRPSNTTFVKQFYSRFSGHVHDDAEKGSHVAGYINETEAIDEISFKMDTGNFDGVIQMYGIK